MWRMKKNKPEGADRLSVLDDLPVPGKRGGEGGREARRLAGRGAGRGQAVTEVGGGGSGGCGLKDRVAAARG